MSVNNLVDSIIDARSAATAGRALLVGVSGIDASGKGYIANHVSRDLELAGYRVAFVNVDGWLNLPNLRFSIKHPGKHFYDHALRLDEMFEQLILPLQKQRSIDLTVDFAEETATLFRPQRFSFKDVDIILLEGIFIFKREFAPLFDLKIWIECSFETALGRAVDRGQEGLSWSDTVAAYETIYFPAQRIHFERDAPQSVADIIFENN